MEVKGAQSFFPNLSSAYEFLSSGLSPSAYLPFLGEYVMLHHVVH